MCTFWPPSPILCPLLLPLVTTSLFSMSMSLGFFVCLSLVCLDCIYKRYHTVFVTLCLTYFKGLSVTVAWSTNSWLLKALPVFSLSLTSPRFMLPPLPKVLHMPLHVCTCYFQFRTHSPYFSPTHFHNIIHSLLSPRSLPWLPPPVWPQSLWHGVKTSYLITTMSLAPESRDGAFFRCCSRCSVNVLWMNEFIITLHLKMAYIFLLEVKWRGLILG